MPQYPASTATKHIILFDTRGDSCADTGGSLWDLLASAGSVDPEGMTVVWVDGAAMRALPLGAAIAQTLDAKEQARMVTTLRERAAGYTKLATMLAEVEVKPEPVEEAPELPAEAVPEPLPAPEPIPEPAPEPAPQPVKPTLPDALDAGMVRAGRA